MLIFFIYSGDDETSGNDIEKFFKDLLGECYRAFIVFYSKNKNFFGVFKGVLEAKNKQTKRVCVLKSFLAKN